LCSTRRVDRYAEVLKFGELFAPPAEEERRVLFYPERDKRDLICVKASAVDIG
jgi:hypothetical protein